MADKHQVVPDIHDEDFILRFLATNPVLNSPETAITYYFDDGKRSADNFVNIVKEAFSSSNKELSILEFA